MDQIHALIGFEQIAPDPLPDMRLTGDQQHSERLPYSLDADNRPIVCGGEFGRGGLDFDFEQIGSGMVDGDGEFDLLLRRQTAFGHQHTIAPHPGFERLASASGLLDAETQDLFFAHQSEARTIKQHNAPVMFFLMAGNQGV